MGSWTVWVGLAVAVDVVLAALVAYRRDAGRGSPPGVRVRLVCLAGAVTGAGLLVALVGFLGRGMVSRFDDLPWHAPWWWGLVPGTAAMATVLGAVVIVDLWCLGVGRPRPHPGLVDYQRPYVVALFLLVGSVIASSVWWPIRDYVTEQRNYDTAPVVELDCIVTDTFIGGAGNDAPVVPIGMRGDRARSAAAAQSHDLFETDRCGLLEDVDDATGRDFDEFRSGDCVTVDVKDFRGPYPYVDDDARRAIGGEYHSNVGLDGDCPPLSGDR